MITLTVDYEVLPDRLVTIRLPEAVVPGRHELVIVLEEQPSQAGDNEAKLNAFIKQRYELSLSEAVIDAEEIFTKMAARHAG